MDQIEARRYRVLSVLGAGGFGKVYRARLEGPEGFEKEVAIKLLHDPDAPESVLSRFRDEARILGLVRDRAIVGVDPPTRLGGRWAVVMEYVDGRSAATLLRRGAFPPAVAVEVVAEVSRALDKVWHQPGPDGDPLHLLHRDLKPANIQITPSGEVKLLDFGIARATFAKREARTTAHIGGTFGYIAPERLDGDEGPEADVFSLGVVLQEMITGEEPIPLGQRMRKNWRREEQRSAAGDPVLQLAHEMSNLEPEDRPTARDVERRCRELLRQLEPPYLRDWAEDVVPQTHDGPADELVGSLLSETMSSVPRSTHATIADLSRLDSSTKTAPGATKRIAMAAGGGAVALFLAIGVIVVVAAAIGIGVYMSTRPESTVATTEPTEIGPETPDEPADKDTAEPVVGVLSAAAAEPEPSPSPTPVRTPRRTPTPVVAPEPPPEPTPEPTPTTVAAAPPTEPATPGPLTTSPPVAAGPTYNLLLSSIPMGATVRIDGVVVGTTPMSHPTPGGDHVIQMESGGKVGETHARVGRRGPTRYVWKSGEDLWESGY